MRILLILLIATFSYGAQGPKYEHSNPVDKMEWDHIYNIVPSARDVPKIFISAGAPSFTPAKVGDVDISTTTGKVYIATATATSSSWAVLN